MRLDRFLTLNLFAPLRRLGVGAKGPFLPILMYHSVSEDPEPGVRAYYRVCTSPQRFAEQMSLLARLGLQGVDLKTGLSALALNAQPPAPSAQRGLVAITFDDGFHDFYTAAWPVLQQHRFSATMYLPTAFIGKDRRISNPSTGNRPPPTGQRTCLTWAEVKELHAGGIEIGSHTATHPKLADLDWSAIERELRESKATIEQQLGGLVASFAYPYAFPAYRKAGGPANPDRTPLNTKFPASARSWASHFCELVKSCGYHNCVTTQIGEVRAGDDPYTLKRLPMNGLDDDALATAKLSGAYNWLEYPQRWVKRWKQWASNN